MEIFCCPLGLVADHPLEYIHSEGLPWTMKSYRHPSAIGVTVSLMTSTLVPEYEAVPIEGIDNFASG